MLEKKLGNPFYRIAWHPSLLCIMGATAIWGLFPMFFHYMDKFQENFTLSYLVLRFLLTALIFIILFVCFNKRVLMLKFARRHYKTLIYGGVIMFLVRFTETRAFEQGYTTFATIFCVALVPLMEPPAMYLYRVLRPLSFIFGKQGYQRMRRITVQKSNYWLEYGLTSVTVLAAAMIFMYAQDGYILLDPQGENQNLLNAFVYVLLSAFGLTLYFHTLEYGFSSSDAEHELGDNETTVCKQACFCLTALFCFLLLSWVSEEQVVANISAKLTLSAYKFWIAMAGGIVLLGSVAAYFLSNLGHDKYKTNKEKLPFRIEAGEWLALSTFFDPLFASLLTGLFTYIADAKPAHPSFFFVAMLFICILVVIKILMLRYTNIQKMKVLCFSHLRSARIRGKAIEPKRFVSVALIENLDKLRNDDKHLKIRPIDQYDHTDTTQHQKETPLRNHLRHVLWRFNCDQLENRNYAALWLCQNGKQLYGARRLFERLLFSEHMRYFCNTQGLGGRMVLLFPDKLGIDEDTFLNHHQEIKAEDDDQLFYFIPVENRAKEAAELKAFLNRMLEFIKNQAEFKNVQEEVMNAILKEPFEKEK